MLQQRNWPRPRRSTRAVTCPSPARPRTECSGTGRAIGIPAWPSPRDGRPDAPEGWPCLGQGGGAGSVRDLTGATTPTPGTMQHPWVSPSPGTAEGAVSGSPLAPMLQALAGKAAGEFTGCPQSLHLNLGEKAAPLLQPLRSKGAHVQCREAPSSGAPRRRAG